MLLRLLALARAPVELAEAEVAVGDERASVEFRSGARAPNSSDLRLPFARDRKRYRRNRGFDCVGLQAVDLTISAFVIAATRSFEPNPQREIDVIA